MRKLPILLGLFLLMGVVSPLFSQEEEIPEIEVKVEVEAEKEKPVKVETITAEKAEEAIGAQSFADVIARLPGTQTIYGCAMNSPRLSFRGSNYTYLQMLVEGINLNPLGSCVLERVPWRSMAEIDVLRGPVPVSYPGNTTSGVVSMKMKTGDKYPGTGFIATYGTYNTQNFDFVYGGGEEMRNWFVAFNRSSNDGWMPNSRVDLSDFSFKIVNSPDDTSSKWTIAGVLLQGEKGGFKPLGPNIAGVVQVNPATGKAEIIGYLYEQRWPNLRRPGLSIAYDKQLNDKTHMMFRVSPVVVTYDLYVKRGLLKDPSTFEPLGKAQIEMMKTRLKYHLIRTELNYDITISKDILSWGIFWEKDWRKSTPMVPANYPQSLSWSEQDMSYKGVFAQYTKALSPLQAVVLGLRFDDTDPGGGAFVPFFDYHLKTDPVSDLRFSFTRNKRFPTLDELYSSGINIGNPNLKPPIANMFQLDWERKLSDAGKLTATLFYQKEEDKIVSDENYVWQNIGSSKQKGLELSYEHTAGSTDFWSNYTYLDTEDSRTGGPLIPAYRTAPPSHMLKAGVTVKGTKGFSYTAEVFWWGERKTNVSSPKKETWFKEDGEIITVTTPSSLPSVLIFNIGITKSLSEGSSLTLSIQNLFDKDWEEMVFYPKDGRWVMLSLSQKF